MTMTLDGTNGVTFFDTSLQGAAASPFGLKNKLINGAMVVDQRNAGAATANTINGYTLDRWNGIQSVTGKIIVQQNAAAVTPPTGFNYYLGVTSQSSYSVLAGDYYYLSQPIEGYNVADLDFGKATAKTVTLSFWVRSSLTGTFGGALRGATATRSYPFTYTISVANTWEQKSVTIAGDTSGTWLTTNGLGLDVIFSLGIGTTYSGTAGAWAATNYGSATGATSVVGTNGATFYLTGVQLEVGSTATPFERRLYGQELANCQRYYYRTPNTTTGNILAPIGLCSSSTGGIASVVFPVQMRTIPTSLEQTGTASNYYVWASNTGSVNLTSVPSFASSISTSNIGVFSFGVASGIVAGNTTSVLSNSANSYLGFSAEL